MFGHIFESSVIMSLSHNNPSLLTDLPVDTLKYILTAVPADKLLEFRTISRDFNRFSTSAIFEQLEPLARSTQLRLLRCHSFNFDPGTITNSASIILNLIKQPECNLFDRIAALLSIARKKKIKILISDAVLDQLMTLIKGDLPRDFSISPYFMVLRTCASYLSNEQKQRLLDTTRDWIDDIRDYHDLPHRAVLMLEALVPWLDEAQFSAQVAIMRTMRSQIFCYKKSSQMFAALHSRLSDEQFNALRNEMHDDDFKMMASGLLNGQFDYLKIHQIWTSDEQINNFLIESLQKTFGDIPELRFLQRCILNRSPLPKEKVQQLLEDVTTWLSNQDEPRNKVASIVLKSLIPYLGDEHINNVWAILKNTLFEKVGWALEILTEVTETIISRLSNEQIYHIFETAIKNYTDENPHTKSKSILLKILALCISHMGDDRIDNALFILFHFSEPESLTKFRVAGYEIFRVFLSRLKGEQINAAFRSLCKGLDDQNESIQNAAINTLAVLLPQLDPIQIETLSKKRLWEINNSERQRIAAMNFLAAFTPYLSNDEINTDLLNMVKTCIDTLEDESIAAMSAVHMLIPRLNQDQLNNLLPHMVSHAKERPSYFGPIDSLNLISYFFILFKIDAAQLKSSGTTATAYGGLLTLLDDVHSKVNALPASIVKSQLGLFCIPKSNSSETRAYLDNELILFI